MSEDCIFCKIVNNPILGARVAEDDYFIAILDIHPATKGHTLVIPKAHCMDLLDMPEDIAARLSPFIQRVARAVKRAVGADGFNVFQNNGAAAGQVVMHYHAHIAPRFNGDGLKHTFVPGNTPPPEEMAELAKKIAENLE